MSKATTENRGEGPVTVHHADLEGGYSADILAFAADVDLKPLLRGLPDDLCPCPHWGYVISGRIVFTFPTGEEVHETGDAFYAPGGDTPVMDAGTEYVQFSPTEQMALLDETIQRNLGALRGA